MSKSSILPRPFSEAGSPNISHTGPLGLAWLGDGVSRLKIARECAANRATLVIQETIQPFRWDTEKKKTATNEMHEHALPWPIELLRNLGDRQLRMRVTLSYFIEPSPGRRGWNRNHRYQSFGLRFDVKRPGEHGPVSQTHLQRRMG